MTLPGQVAAVTRDSTTSPTQVVVSWTALSLASDTGSLPILSYQLEFDQGSGEPTGSASWQSLVGNPSPSLLLKYSVNGSGVVTSGTTYRFRVRASNALGWGPWSEVTAVLAAAVPS